MTNFTLKNPEWLPVGHFFSLSRKSCMIADLFTLMKKCLLARFRKKSDLLLIWHICSAMSANDLINFLGSNNLKMAV